MDIHELVSVSARLRCSMGMHIHEQHVGDEKGRKSWTYMSDDTGAARTLRCSICITSSLSNAMGRRRLRGSALLLGMAELGNVFSGGGRMEV